MKYKQRHRRHHIYARMKADAPQRALLREIKAYPAHFVHDDHLDAMAFLLDSVSFLQALQQKRPELNCNPVA